MYIYSLNSTGVRIIMWQCGAYSRTAAEKQRSTQMDSSAYMVVEKRQNNPVTRKTVDSTRGWEMKRLRREEPTVIRNDVYND